jgi:hypothetical protein
MANIKPVYGASTALTVTGLSTLANGSTVTSATVTNTDYLDALVYVTINVGAAALATGVVEVYAVGSTDGTNFDTNANDKWIGTVSLVAAGTQTTNRVMTVAASFGGVMPPSWRVRFRNSTGDALTAATVSYRGVAAQTV